MLRVRDIMTPHVITLRADATLESAAWTLATEQVSGAPVRNDRGDLVGVITKSDLADVLHDFDHGDGYTVNQVMTPTLWCVHPDEPALTAVRLMLDKGIHRVVVCRNRARLEGIVSTTDVLRAVARGHRFVTPNEAPAVVDVPRDSRSS